MPIMYPFIPKSNINLNIGQFWPIILEDGNYGCGIILDLPEGIITSKRLFYAGLLNWANTSKSTINSLQSPNLKLLAHGQAHIKTIVSQNEGIEGCIDLTQNSLVIDQVVDSQNYSPNSYVKRGYEVVRKATHDDHKNLQTQSTWGYSHIIILANKLLVIQNYI